MTILIVVGMQERYQKLGNKNGGIGEEGWRLYKLQYR